MMHGGLSRIVARILAAFALGFVALGGSATTAHAAGCNIKAGMDFGRDAAWSMPLTKGCTSQVRHRYDPVWSSTNYWTAWRYNTVIGWPTYDQPAAEALYLQSGSA